MYEFLTGPMVWISFGIFIIGLIVRGVRYIKGLDWKLDRVTYHENISYGVKGALRSILFWIFPYGTRSWRKNPWFTLWVFTMHFGLLFTPILLLGHNVLFKEKWGFSLWALPEAERDPPWEWRAARRRGSATTAVPAHPRPVAGPVVCGSRTYCREMASCAEARAYLEQCGLKRLDGDGDGVPCESLCRGR